MSGHSKWATIKRQKEATDSQRGKAFSKISRTISLAAKSGTDPETNFKLRIALQQAKQVNMPKENILRAIKRGSGEVKGENWEEITFEGYGPSGVGIILEVVTDNKNRSTAEIKNLFERVGGSLTGPGAVAYQFKKIGLIKIEKNPQSSEQILKLMDFGVEDVNEGEEIIEVVTVPEELNQIRDKIVNAGMVIREAGLSFQPQSWLKIDNPQSRQQLSRFIKSLEEREDVQNVYLNVEENQ
jgi:YebC/PmpR family DNA-binding regulatory protein